MNETTIPLGIPGARAIRNLLPVIDALQMDAGSGRLCYDAILSREAENLSIIMLLLDYSLHSE